jgi:hypothetical protein
MAHCTYPAIPENHVTERERGGGGPFTDNVGDPDTKMQLLLGGKKTVNKALRQTLQLQDMFLAAKPK